MAQMEELLLAHVGPIIVLVEVFLLDLVRRR